MSTANCTLPWIWSLEGLSSQVPEPCSEVNISLNNTDHWQALELVNKVVDKAVADTDKCPSIIYYY